MKKKSEDRARSQESRARKSGKSEGGSQKPGEVKDVLKSEVESQKPHEQQSAPATPHHAPVKEQQTANSKLQTENMEVHHHPQLEHKPKPWKEYLLEGLMIFIAVTLGFFAESLREHIAKKDNEQQVITSLVRSIKKDSAFLSNLVNVYIPTHNRWTDSINKDVDSLNLKGNERRITLAIMNATSWNTYAPPEMALNLVKDAGAFDEVGKEKAKERLLVFSARTTGFIKYSQFLTEVEHQIDTAGASFLPRKDERALLVRLYARETTFLTIADIPADVKFKTYNKAVFLAYLRKLDQVDFLLNDMLGDLEALLGEETKLLNVLKEQYNLKDE